MTYRDQREQCPRCGTELIEAGVARGCSSCSGLWLGAGDLREMAANMRVPPEPVPLFMVADSRPPLACPSCKAAMEPRVLHGVEIDVCSKHGIWFDAHELAAVLLQAANH